MLNLDNFYFFILYLIFGIPGGIVLFIFNNILTLLNIGKYDSFKSLWEKEEIIQIFMSANSIFIGIVIFIIVVIIYT
jgi:preprotein translocase subunit SecY